MIGLNSLERSRRGCRIYNLTMPYSIAVAAVVVAVVVVVVTFPA
jgi:hypothetical protein